MIYYAVIGDRLATTKSNHDYIVIFSRLLYYDYMKFKEKLKAVDLRKRGHSYRDILSRLNVSKSTLSIWLRDIELSENQKKKLLNKQSSAAYRGAKAQQKKRIERTQRILKEAKQEMPTLTTKQIFLPGVMLYWAEGAKSTETVKFSNSDPLMIKFMMRWFREICKVPNEKFRIAIHSHSLLVNGDIEKYWSEITAIPLAQFQKTYIKQTSLGQRKNVLYNGTCTICVFNKDLFRRIRGWRFGFLEKIGITQV